MKKFTLGALLATLAALAASLAALKGGFINPEAETFIPHYLTRAPLAQIVFALEHTDWGLYQARELSYFFDWLDCRFIALSCAIGIPHFLSVTHFVGCAAIGLALGFFARRALRLPTGISLGLMGLWLTSPCVLLGGSYYRSAKILAAAALLSAGISAWLYLRARLQLRSGRVQLACHVSSLVVAGLADRQGAFLAAALALWFAIRAGLFRDRSYARLAIAGFLSVAADAVYAYRLGPSLIRHFDGRPPSFEYLSLPWGKLLTDPDRVRFVFWYGPVAAVQEMGVILGGLPWVPLLVGIGWFGWYFASNRDAPAPAKPTRLAATVWYLMPVPGFMIMYALMALRHADAVILEDFKIIYYPLPLAALTALALGLAMSGVRRSGRVRPSVMAVLTWTLVAGNLGNLSHYKYICATGTYGAQIQAGPASIAALKRRAPAANASPAIRAIAEAAGFGTSP